MPIPAAFISYAHRDDEAYGGRITELRRQLALVVGAAIGQDFEIFQDRDGISWGQHWPSRLDDALNQALFLIPILTPSYFNSGPCCAELEKFIHLEGRAGRSDLILPIYFRTARVLQDKSHPLAAVLSERQYRDWRELRHVPLGVPEVIREIDRLADQIEAAIYRTITPTPATPQGLDPAALDPVVLGLDPRTHVVGPPGQKGRATSEESNLGPRVKPEDDKGRRASRVLIGNPGPERSRARSSRTSTRRGARRWW